jgi:AraC-like DNA-binding protein
VPEERGRLSNPVQLQLSASEIDALIGLYRDGFSIDALARRYQLHRTTVINHLDQAGVARRRIVRKMTDDAVARAAAGYRKSASMAEVAAKFGVHSKTLAREFRQAGVTIRPRRTRLAQLARAWLCRQSSSAIAPSTCH